MLNTIKTEESFTQENKHSPTIRYSLIILILIACALDVATYFKSGLYEFEINPLFVLTGSMVLPFLVKGGVNAMNVYMLWKYKHHSGKSYLISYVMVYSALSLIILQFFGAAANVSTSVKYEKAVEIAKETGQPIDVVPMSSQQALSTMSVLMSVVYAFMGLSFITFFLWEKIFLTPDRLA